eukprot:scaffold23530_cov117-Cylindrotheca_fusiformis.AAC.1
MPIRYPEDVADIFPDEVEIYIVGTAGQKITVMNDDFYKQCNPNLERLVLRSHLIQHIKGIQGFTKLELLELYDNQLQELNCLEVPGPNLRVLDMSYNAIRDMSPVNVCVNLTELCKKKNHISISVEHLANNKLKQISGLRGLTNLKKIDLGANRIRVMDEEELGGLINLEELWIGKNKIEKIQGLDKVETLEELFLAHNGIDDEGATQPTGLALKFTNLNVIDMSRNRLTSTAPFAHLEAVEELWLSGNQIATWEGVEPLKESASAGTQSLETLYLEYNPLASEFEYRKKLAEWIPSLSQIDATLVGGLAAHGLPSAMPAPMNTTNTTTKQATTPVPLEAEMRGLQDTVVKKAQEETKAAKKQQQS